ncbi:TrbI/VirB10 family protein [Escherichia coli]|nr:TrbI/VirB10 family protein [Escherichia coli]
MSEENNNNPLSEEEVARQFDASSNKRSRKKTGNIIFTAVIIVFMLCVIGGIIWFAIHSLDDGKSNTSNEPVAADPALNPTSDDNTVARYQQTLEANMKEKERQRKEREEKEKQERQQQKQDEAEADDPFASYNEDSSQSGSTGNGQGGEQPMTPEQRKMQPGIMIDPKGGSFGSSGGNSSSMAQGSNSGPSNDSGENDGLDDIRATANGQGAGQVPGLNGAGGAGDSSNANGTGGNQTYLESHMRNSKFAPGKAYKMPSRDFLLSRGTNLRCTTKQEIISEYPAPLDCTVTKDIYSDNGKNLLVRQGDVVSGEMNVQMTQGKGKLFAAFTMLRGDRGQDDGIQADLASLAVGPMGSAGIDAYVDSHWGERFGNSIMLAFIQDVFSSAKNSTQKSGDYTVNNTENNANDMANKALENSINIPPTGYVLPAKTINIYIMRDIDFSSVYKVRKVQTPNINFDDCNCTK